MASAPDKQELIEMTKHPLIVLAQVERPDVESRYTDKQKAIARAQLEVDVEEGRVSLGPKSQYEKVTKDIVDRRDPLALGTILLGMVALRADCPTLSVAADKVNQVGLTVRNYDSAPVDHAVRRREELEKRAVNGDRFAKAMLNGQSLAEDPVD